jgi:putative tryptophan/tyrosine transport system substrate-binding protein
MRLGAANPIGRREFIALVAGASVAWRHAARGQQPAIPVIGFVRSSSLESVGNLVAAFRQGLKETGFVEGQNVAIEFRSAEDRYEELPLIVAELIRRPVAILVANIGAAQIAKAATTTIPIVFAAGSDPVKDNLVASYNLPGGNVKGVSFLNSDLGAKKLELIRSLRPGTGTLGVLENPNSLISQSERLDTVMAAQSIGQRTVVLKVATEADFDAAFATLDRERAGALLVTGDALFLSRGSKLIALAARYAIPTIYSESLIVQAGGLMSYGASITDAYRQVGIYAGRILKGARPADMPVLQPTKFEFVINLRTAKALGLAVPQSLQLRADEVIQ